MLSKLWALNTDTFRNTKRTSIDGINFGDHDHSGVCDCIRRKPKWGGTYREFISRWLPRFDRFRSVSVWIQDSAIDSQKCCESVVPET